MLSDVIKVYCDAASHPARRREVHVQTFRAIEVPNLADIFEARGGRMQIVVHPDDDGRTWRWVADDPSSRRRYRPPAGVWIRADVKAPLVSYDDGGRPSPAFESLLENVEVYAKFELVCRKCPGRPYEWTNDVLAGALLAVRNAGDSRVSLTALATIVEKQAPWRRRPEPEQG